jgi:hypothetical protein
MIKEAQGNISPHQNQAKRARTSGSSCFHSAQFAETSYLLSKNPTQTPVQKKINSNRHKKMFKADRNGLIQNEFFVN